MLLRLLYDEKLAQASYLVGCQETNEAIVVDPSRDTDQYIALADQEGLRLVAVTETHIHADLVSGSRELAARADARIYLSDEGDEDWKYAFATEPNVTLIKDGDSFMIGNIKLDVMHTPGHTPESVSFVVTDTKGADRPMGVFTGDFVFVGDVGRPDLLETAAGMQGTMEAGARQLYQSLQRFKELPDYIQIWPGHGAGSPCGKALGAVPQTTVGYERLFNWAFNAKTEEEFVAGVLEGQPEPPFYFAHMKKVNKEGPAMAHEIPLPERLPATQIQDALDSGMTIVDTRSPTAYAGGHIPGTLNISHSKSYLTWFGWLISYDEPFALIVDEEKLTETVHDLRLIGFDNIYGYWTPEVIESWSNSGQTLATFNQIWADDVEQITKNSSATILDVRGSAEYVDGHIPGAVNIPIGYIPQRADEIPANKPVVVHCQTGVRSSIAISLLETLGRSDVKNYIGSFADWEAKDKPIEAETKQPESSAVS